MTEKMEVLKNLPGIDSLMATNEVKSLVSSYGTERVRYALRQSVEFFREQILNNAELPDNSEIIKKSHEILKFSLQPRLKKVINATGIIIHTNLGRAPLGKKLLGDAGKILEGYSNLEFDLSTASRGNRNDHAAEILKYLTGAEDVMVVNNNAAAVMLVLNTFANKKEVIISRSELIEIGGSFRIPDIMEASGCIMKEVGTTNKTSTKDFEKAVSKKTALLFKAHKSNYVIKGFTKEVELAELVELGRKLKLPVCYDLGSGLLRRPAGNIFKSEPTVKDSIAQGPDLVTFSGDKLIGGPQSGIIAGKKKYIDALKKQPIARALRVCKTTLSLLEAACMCYMDDEDLLKNNKIFSILNQSSNDLQSKAERLKSIISDIGLNCKVEKTKGQYGGGSMPDEDIESFSVVLDKIKKPSARELQYELLQLETPVLCNLHKGCISFDVLTIDELEFQIIKENIAEVYRKFGL